MWLRDESRPVLDRCIVDPEGARVDRDSGDAGHGDQCETPEASSHFSQSIAAAQPEPAAVMAWR